MGLHPRAYSWFLDYIMPLEPYPVKGMLGLFEIDIGPLMERDIGKGLRWWGVHARVLKNGGATLPTNKKFNRFCPKCGRGYKDKQTCEGCKIETKEVW